MPSEPLPKPATKRVLELDALRGLAALAVVAFHFTTRYDQLFGHTADPPASVPWGHYGVDLFFMLSGYVILMSLERSRNAVTFAWGRFTRLYPTYWFAAAFTLTVVTFVGLPGQEVSPYEALLNVTMVQSLLGASHIDGAYWSLQAELIFYANMLVLHRLGAFRRPAAAIVLWVGCALLCQAAIRLAAADAPVAFDALRKLRTLASFEYLPLFGLGMALRATEAGRLARGVAMAACFAAIAVTQPPETLAVDLLLAALLAAAVGGRLPWLAWSPLVWLGAVSYPLYLIHQNVGFVVIRELEAAGVTPAMAITSATLVGLLLASWLHRGVEVPSLAALRRVDPTGWLVRSRVAKPIADRA